jgi:hypothetical protein
VPVHTFLLEAEQAQPVADRPRLRLLPEIDGLLRRAGVLYCSQLYFAGKQPYYLFEADGDLSLLSSLVRLGQLLRAALPNAPGLSLACWTGGGWRLCQTVRPWPSDADDRWDQLAADAWRLAETADSPTTPEKTP